MHEEEIKDQRGCKKAQGQRSMWDITLPEIFSEGFPGRLRDESTVRNPAVDTYPILESWEGAISSPFDTKPTSDPPKLEPQEFHALDA